MPLLARQGHAAGGGCPGQRGAGDLDGTVVDRRVPGHWGRDHSIPARQARPDCQGNGLSCKELAYDTAYQVTVAALSKSGPGPARSAAVTPQVTVPSAPMEAAVAPTASGLVASWQPSLSYGGYQW